MRKSQFAMLAALGTVIVVMLGIAVWVGVVVPPAPPLPELSGENTMRTFDFQGFDGVEVRGQWQVTVTRGDSWRIAANVPVELKDDVSIELEGGRLVVNTARARWGNFGGRDEPRMTAEITMPVLVDVRLSGASSLEFSGFDGGELTIVASGAVHIVGSASRFDELALTMSGAGKADLRDVNVADANVTSSGAANITLRMAGGVLSGQMSGVGSLEYYGSLSEERIVKSGLVNVRRAN